jgi:NADH-quinone oxidoreductase subunit E
MEHTETNDVSGIVQRYAGDPGMLIPMMQDLQAEHGYLPQPELVQLARAVHVPLSRVYSVATFYASFLLAPKGQHTIQLCMGTVCFLKGAGRIAQAIQEEFQVSPGTTSPDGKFTFCPVNCVGACALAPVMIVDGEYYGGLATDSALGVLRKIAANREPGAGGSARVGEGAKERPPSRGSNKP